MIRRSKLLIRLIDLPALLSKWPNPKGFCSVFLCFLCATLMLASSTISLADPRYYFNDGNDIQTRHPDWMSWIPDATPLGDISMPGTHDSMSLFNGTSFGYAKAQSVALDRQLLAGIRAFDIRARHINDKFAIHHGAIFQFAFFGDVLAILNAFLDAHPTETVLIRLKEEHDPESNNRTFPATYRWYRGDAVSEIDGVTKLGRKIWQRPGTLRQRISSDGSTYEPTTQCDSLTFSKPSGLYSRYQHYVPTLGEVRGKIVILQDYEPDYVSIGSPKLHECDGIKFSSKGNKGNTSKLRVQDESKVYDVWDFDEKWAVARTHLINMKSDTGIDTSYDSMGYGGKPEWGTQLFINFTSDYAAAAADPKTVADGDCCNRGVNDYALEFLLTAKLERTGILMMDFPGEALIDSIIAHNFPLRASSAPITRGDKHFDALSNDFGYAFNNIAYGGTEIGGDEQARDRRDELKGFFDHVLPEQNLNYYVVIDDVDSYAVVDDVGLYKQTDWIDTDNWSETREYSAFAFNTKTSPPYYSDSEIQAFVDERYSSGDLLYLGSSVEGIVSALRNWLRSEFPLSNWSVFARGDDGGFDNWAYSVADPANFYRKDMYDWTFVIVGTGYACTTSALTKPTLGQRLEGEVYGRPYLFWSYFENPNSPRHELQKRVGSEWDAPPEMTEACEDSQSAVSVCPYDREYVPDTPLVPGNHYYRLRALPRGEPGCDAEEPGPWSDTLTVVIPEVPVLFETVTISEDEAGLGTGTVTLSAPPVSQVGGDYFLPGETITVTANPADQSEFTGWQGDAASCGSQLSCPITIVGGQPVDIQAVFRPKPRLSVFASGGGTVAIGPEGAACGNTEYACFIYPTGTTVAMTATANADSVFDSWSGPDDCLDGSVSLANSLICRAIFTRTSYDLRVNASPGSEITSDPAGAINCGTGADCSEAYPVSGGKQTVVLTASINPGSEFVRWSGPADCWDEDEGDNNPLRISVTVGAEDVTCSAITVLQGTEYALTIEKRGGGAVSAEAQPAADSSGIDCPLKSCSQNYPLNTQIQLMAKASKGAEFAGFESPDVGLDGYDPQTDDCLDGQVEMTANISCVAKFSSRILVVKGSDTDLGKEQNPYLNALRNQEQAAFDIWDIKNPAAGDNSIDPLTGQRRIEPSAEDLANYGRVVWYTGQTYAGKSASAPAAGPSAAAEVSLGTYLDNGGCLMMSSPNYYQDRGLTAFMRTYLGVKTVTEDVGESYVKGAGNPYLGFSELSADSFAGTGSEGYFRLGSLSSIDAFEHDPGVPGSDSLFIYRTGLGEAAIAVDNGTFRTAFLGFEFEKLANGDPQNSTMRAFLDLCGQTELDDPYELNDEFDQATERFGTVSLGSLKIVADNEDYFEWVSDWYADTAFNIAFDHSKGDLVLEVYDDTRALIGSSQTLDDNESLVVPAADGGRSYFVRVYGVANASNYYSLDITQAGASDLDQDGVPDVSDALPNDPDEQSDADGDLIGDNADLDDDNDGMPDTFETQYGFDALNSADALLDNDNDGVTNVDEHLGGSDPLDASSTPLDEAGLPPPPPAAWVDQDRDTIPDSLELLTDRDPLLADWTIDAGGNHSCALDDSGVACWGDDTYGQSTVPDLNNPLAVSAGDNHSCALDDTGVTTVVQCWGAGKTDTGTAPELGQSLVPSLMNPSAVSTGKDHSCALDDTGVVCWGDDSYGQAAAPDLVSPVVISAGDYHSCAVDKTGAGNSVHCWGDSAYDRTDVPVLNNPVSVTVGDFHSCALDDSGVVCWGAGSNNGGGLDFNQSIPPQLLNPLTVSAGNFHSCALDDNGVECWGNDGNGQVAVPDLIKPVAVSAGAFHTCALDDRGVVCWGYNELGQATDPALAFDKDLDGLLDSIEDANGNGVWDVEAGETDSLSADTDRDGLLDGVEDADADSFVDAAETDPLNDDTDADGVKDGFDFLPLDTTEARDVDGDGIGDNADTDDDNDTIPDVLELETGRNPLMANWVLDAGNYHNCVLADGGVECWGYNNIGQTLVPVLANPTQVSAGRLHTCAIDQSDVVCWGDNDQGQAPALTTGFDKPRVVAAGAYHSCVMDAVGVTCWGEDTLNQLQVPALVNPRALAVSSVHTCVLDDTGVVCWGDDTSGKTLVPDLKNPVAVSAGWQHTCALSSSGVTCWGSNDDGQIDVPLDLIHPWAISAGERHSCAIDDTGVRCWGLNDYGQSDPPELLNPVSISLGYKHSCALDDTGVKCWGLDNVGQANIPALQFDKDLDGLLDSAEDLNSNGIVDAGETNPLDADTDDDAFSDGEEVAAGSNPLDYYSTPVSTLPDGDLNDDGSVDLQDMLLAHKLLLGELEINPGYLQRGDVAPVVDGVATPNGEFNLGDVLIIQQLVLSP